MSARIIVAAGLMLLGCGEEMTASVPPAPLPTVEPCHEDAVMALTEQDQDALVRRDALMREHIEALEALLRDE